MSSRLLGFEEQSQDEIVKEVCNQRVGTKKQEENRKSQDKGRYICELEHVKAVLIDLSMRLCILILFEIPREVKSHEANIAQRTANAVRDEHH